MTMTCSVQTGLCIALCLFLSAPIASADDGKLTGNVMLNAKPLAEGKITVHMPNGQFVGSIIKDGKYQIDRVITGTFKVTIEGEKVPPAFTSEKTTSLKVDVKKGPSNIDFNIND